MLLRKGDSYEYRFSSNRRRPGGLYPGWVDYNIGDTLVLKMSGSTIGFQYWVEDSNRTSEFGYYGKVKAWVDDNVADAKYFDGMCPGARYPGLVTVATDLQPSVHTLHIQIIDPGDGRPSNRFEVLGAMVAGVRTNNLVLNAGFEGSSNSCWNLSSHFSLASDNKHSGMNSIKLSGTGDGCSMYQTVSVSQNTNYTLSIYGKSSSSGANFKVTDSTGSIIIQDGETTTGNNVWTRYNLDFNSGNNTGIRVYIEDSGEGTHYFDDFFLMKNAAAQNDTWQ